MRRKATAKKSSLKGAQGNANSNIKARENTSLKVIKPIVRPTKTPPGKGLGKAGAKRLGRLLKRAIQDQEESSVRGTFALPKTPVRLFKHQVQTEAENAPKTKCAKPTAPHVPQLILSVVSQCKRRGGISMAELKQALAAGGYDVTKNNRRVNVVTQRLVNNETLVRITRNASLRLNKKQAVTKQVRTSSVKSPKPKGDLKQSKTDSKSSQGAGKTQKQPRKTPKPKGKTRKPATKSHTVTGKTRKPATKSRTVTGKTRKPATKSRTVTGKTRKLATKLHKLTGKTRKPATTSHKPRRKAPKARTKSPKPAGKKLRSATNRVARVRKAAMKTQRARRRRPKQKRHPYKSPWKRPLPRQRPRLKTRQRRFARRRSHYD